MKLKVLTAILSLTAFVLVFSTSRVMGKGDAFSDPCRTKSSTTVISARVRVSLPSNSSNLAVSISFSDNSGGGITYTPNPLTFDIPSDQTENTGYFTMSSASANMGAYNVTATGTVTDIDTGSVLYSGDDTETMTVYQVEFTSIPDIVPGAANSIDYTIAFPASSNCGSLVSGMFEVFDLENNLVYTAPLDYSEGAHVIVWDGKAKDGSDIADLNDVFMDLMVEKADGRTETGDTGKTSSTQASRWKLKYSIPDDLSGISLSTVTPTSVTTNVTLYDNDEVTIVVNNDISDYEVVKNGTDAQITLKKDIDSNYLFVSNEVGNEKKYQITVTSTAGGGLDNAGNEWDMDPSTGGIQRKVVWKFKLSSTGTFSKWDGSDGYGQTITNN